VTVSETDPAGPAPSLESEPRTTPVELLWDLVFVFAVTQVTTLLTDSLSWAGFGRAMLVLALVWWAWSAFVWAANAQLSSGTLRLALLPATGFIFIAGLALPHAFGDEAVLFACTYAVVRFLHLALYADASRKGNAAWSAIAGFAATVAVGMILLILGSCVGGLARTVLWIVAVAIDYAGPAWLTRERLRGLQSVAVAHFAERYSLFVIICLGESIVSVGAGALGGGTGPARTLTPALVAAAAFLLLITVGLLWAYFERSAAAAEGRLRGHDDPVLAAADGYSYLHLPIVAGIILFAVGARLLLRSSPGAELAGPDRLVLCTGVAVYLLAHLAFGVRLGLGFARWRLPAAAALFLLYLAGGELPGWGLAAVVATILAVLSAAEAGLRLLPLRRGRPAPR
jgi:low temperature requirement protein LtrA